MPDSDKPEGSRPHGPEVVAPSNRVNVALPFSTMHIEQPSRELVEIASALADLAAVVEASLQVTRHGWCANERKH